LSFLDEYYRAYKEFQDEVAPLELRQLRLNAVKNADKGADSQTTSASLRVIDMDWVEAIERCVAPMDIAIRENRRFIKTEEEVVPIEKSRRITTESVRHLAQHTNLIARVEGDQITPESILNVRHEESFAIYENRFLVLVVETVLAFIEKRYEALCQVSGSSLSQLDMQRNFSTKREHTTFHLEYSSEYADNSEYNIDDDVTTLTDFQRVSRVRKIYSAFSASALIRGLKGVQPVRPPITRTNLMTKNPNYRACLELYLFLESYHKTGFDILRTESHGEMQPEMKDGIGSAMDMLHFLVYTRNNPQLEQKLQQNYQQENARRLAEQQQKEQERLQQEQQRLQAAVEAEHQLAEQKLQQLALQHAQQLAELEKTYQTAIADQKAAYEQQLAAQKTAYETALAEQKTAYEQQLVSLQAQHVAAVAALQASHANALAEQKAAYEQLLARQQADCETALADQKTGYEQQLVSLQAQHVAADAALQARYTAALADQKAAYEQQLATQKTAFETALADQEADSDAALSREQAAHARTRTDSQARLDALIAAHARELNAYQQRRDREKTAFVENLQRQRAKTQLLDRQLRETEKKAAELQRQLTVQQQQNRRITQQLEKTEALYQKKLDSLAKKAQTELQLCEKRAQHRYEQLQRQLYSARKKHPGADPIEEVFADTQEQEVT